MARQIASIPAANVLAENSQARKSGRFMTVPLHPVQMFKAPQPRPRWLFRFSVDRTGTMLDRRT